MPRYMYINTFTYTHTFTCYYWLYSLIDSEESWHASIRQTLKSHQYAKNWMQLMHNFSLSLELWFLKLNFYSIIYIGIINLINNFFSNLRLPLILVHFLVGWYFCWPFRWLHAYVVLVPLSQCFFLLFIIISANSQAKFKSEIYFGRNKTHLVQVICNQTIKT